MRKLFLGLALLGSWGWPMAMPGQEMKVELFSGRRLVKLALNAGAEDVALCALPRQQPCFALPRGETAQCLSAGAALQCSAPGWARKFSSLAASSRAAFRIQPGLAPPASSAAAPSVTLRELDLAVTRQGFRVVATIELEPYVAAVVAGEASVLRSPAALEAMAIVARTWALRYRGRHRAQGFDFCSLTHCQALHMLWAATGSSSPNIKEAVRRTHGQVLLYQHQLVDPYFGADCGGVTEAAGELWPDRGQPYLVSLPDPYCSGSSHAHWQRGLSLKDTETILRASLHLPLHGPLTDLAIAAKNGSGRARTLLASGGSEWRIDANQFRYAANRRLGWATLKSNLYTLKRHGDSLVFTGRGLGHGVGLCQEGAEQRGRMGHSSEQILAAYFPGTTVGRAPLGSPATGDLDPVLSSEHFQLILPSNQQQLAQRTLETLENFYRELGKRAEGLPKPIRVQAYDSTSAFIQAAGQPGWVAASTDGHAIALQPLPLLARKGILEQTLRHELAHLVIDRLRAAQVPHWFEEGLVLYWTHEQIAGVKGSLSGPRTLEEIISMPRSEGEMKAAYAEAVRRVRELARRLGEAALWRILQNPTADDLRQVRQSP